LHYSDVVEVARSLNGHNIVPRVYPYSSVFIRNVDAPIVTVRRLILATLCALATLLVPNPAPADSLRAKLDGDGIHDRIEFGRRSREFDIRLSAARCWQGPRGPWLPAAGH
jgi:hypothetical protein